jgi:signal transduction histidine kinase
VGRWSLVDRFLPARLRDGGAGVAFWRERLLAGLLLTTVVLGTLAIVPSVILSVRHGAIEILVIDLVVYAAAVGLLFGRELPYRVRSTAILVLFWVLSGALLLELGPISAGPLWVLASLLFTSVLASLHATLVAIALSAVFFAGLEWLVVGRHVPWATEVADMGALWLVIAVNLIMLEGMIGLASSLVLRTLDSANSEHERLELAAARARELEEENRRMHEANRTKSEFLANMSHELRTPLNAIIGFAEILSDRKSEPNPGQARDFANDILNSGRHLLHLIGEMLDLAKVDAGRLELDYGTVELGPLVDEVFSILAALTEPKRIVVRREIEPGLTTLEVDPVRFKQILFNYLSNAIKFTSQDGEVGLRLKLAGDGEFRLEVWDTGIGIAERDLGRLFVEFQQLDSPLRKRHAGTGLGLALTKRLVEAHGGTVGVMSQLGKGSLFWAVMPRRRPGG